MFWIGFPGFFCGFWMKLTTFHVLSSVAFYESRDYFGFWSFKVRINRKDETEALKVSIVVLIQLTLNRIHHPFNITNHFWYRVARCPRDNHHKCHLSAHPSKAIKTNIQYIMNLESFSCRNRFSGNSVASQLKIVEYCRQKC